MIFPQGLVALLAASNVVSAVPGLFKRQASSCASSYACPFQINVNGCGSSQIDDGQVRIPSSAISQLGDGQARCDVNGSAPSNFTLSNGQVTDSAGRVCEISKQNQFQCSAMVDAGATTTGFSVCSGLLSFNSNSSFVACLATGDIPGYNIYTANVDQSTVTNCTAVQLSVPACAVSSSSSSCVPSTVTATVVSTNVPAAVTVVQTTTAAPVTVNQTLTAAPVTVVQTQTQTAAPVTVLQTQTQTAAPVTVVQTTTAAPVTVNQTLTVVQTQTQSKTQTQIQTAAPVTVVQTQTPAPVTIVQTHTATVNQTLTQTVSKTSTVTVTSIQTQPITIVQTSVVTVVTTVPTTVQAPATTLKVTTTSSSAQATCTNITRALGSSNFPNTIEVVNSGSSLSGSSYFGNIGNGNSTIFTFNPTGASGQCSLSFYFPTTEQIVAASGTTAYEISSSSIAVTLYELAAVAPVTSTFANKPARGAAFSATLTPGTNTTFETFTCPTVQTSYELVATDSNTLNFFADYNLPVLSLVIASCN